MKDEFYGKLITWVENIGIVMGEEIPSFVSEMATYGFYSNLILTIVCIFVVIFCTTLVVKIFSNEDIDFDLEFAWGFICFFSIAFAILCMVLSCMFINDAIKAKCAPRLYVIERLLNR